MQHATIIANFAYKLQKLKRIKDNQKERGQPEGEGEKL